MEQSFQLYLYRSFQINMPRVEVFDRADVLEKVKHLFWNKGFNGTSMQDLVDTTGLNRSSLYNSFGNKKAIYELVLKQYQEESKIFFDNAISEAKNPLEAIHIIFTSITHAIHKDQDGKGCFIMNCTTELSRSDIELKRFLIRNSEGIISLFDGLIKKGQTIGVINTRQTAQQYALYLYSFLQGIRVTGVLMNDKTKLDQLVKNTLYILI